MELWDQVVKAAFLGTGREPLAPAAAGGALGRVLQDVAGPGGDPQAALLGAASALFAYRRAGFVPPESAGAATTPSAAQDLPVFGPRASAHLARMLGERESLGRCLPEWLAAAAATGRRAREESLPDLLDAGVKKEELRPAILPVLGRRGLWLAGQNTAWGYAAGGEVADEAQIRQAWETADRDRRALLLAALRAKNPAAARELVGSTWKEDPADARAAMVLQLQPGLSADDEAFLEAALDDRGQEVRQNAARLLARLPGSAFVRRMTDRARLLLAWAPEKGAKKARVELTPPDDIDKAAERDQVQRKSHRYGVGEKAWWAYQIISAVPPATWAAAWQATPRQIVGAIGPKHEWRELLLEAWATAAWYARDGDWARVLAPLDVAAAYEPRRGYLAAYLVEALPADQREAFLVGEIARKDNDRRGHVLVDMLRHVPKPWGAALSRAVLGLVRDGLNVAGKTYNYYLAGEFPGYALNVPPEMLDEAASGWPAEGENWEFWKSAVDQFVGLLQFRGEMLREIGETPPR